MARIAGVNIPNHAHAVIALQSIYGIGPTRAKAICAATGVAPSTKIKDLSDSEMDKIREQVAKFSGGPLPMEADGANQPDPLLLDSGQKKLLQDDLYGATPYVPGQWRQGKAGIVKGNRYAVAGAYEVGKGWRAQRVSEGPSNSLLVVPQARQRFRWNDGTSFIGKGNTDQIVPGEHSALHVGLAPGYGWLLCFKPSGKWLLAFSHWL